MTLSNTIVLGWRNASPVKLDPSGYTVTVNVYGNNYNFPVSAVAALAPAAQEIRSQLLQKMVMTSALPPMKFEDIRTIYTSTWGSTVRFVRLVCFAS